MIYEYALEPKLVATWGQPHNYRFFIRAFGIEHGRHVSRYPKKWAKKVYESFSGNSDMEKKRLEELLSQFKKNMVKRKDCIWDEGKKSWLENALAEHGRHPFHAILTQHSPGKHERVICDDDLNASECRLWDVPTGTYAPRTAVELADAVKEILSLCSWVRFVDPYLSKNTKRHKDTLAAYLGILGSHRPVGPPVSIEIHTSGDGASSEHLKNVYEKIVPAGLQVTFFQWQEKPSGQKLHNRYILTDLGGISFQHGLDAGDEGETDDIGRLGEKQYSLRCKQYLRGSQFFELASLPLDITGLK